MIEEAQIVVHEADYPDLFGDFFDADGLTCEGGTEVDFTGAEAQAAALRDGEGAIVERVLERG